MATIKITENDLKCIVENIMPPNQLGGMIFMENSYILMVKESVIFDCCIIIYLCEIKHGGHKIVELACLNGH